MGGDSIDRANGVEQSGADHHGTTLSSVMLKLSKAMLDCYITTPIPPFPLQGGR